MGTPSESLTKWVIRMLSDLTEDGPITRFQLLHKVEGTTADPLEVWRLDREDPRDAHELAQEMFNVAERDAQSHVSGQPQRYVVCAFRGSSEVHESQHAFLMRGSAPVVRLGEDSEPATEKGLIAHYMRHDENVHRLLMAAGEGLIGKLAQDLERERAARIKAEEFNQSMAERHQALLDREHERRMAEAQQLMKARRLDELMGVATALLPILATKFVSGAAGAPPALESARPAASQAPPDPKDVAIQQFFARLSETEISSVLGCLAPTNQIALAELHRSFSDAHASPSDVMARQISVRKFLKSLSEREVTSIFASLSDSNRQMLAVLYSQYSEIEREEQERKPEILRS